MITNVVFELWDQNSHSDHTLIATEPVDIANFIATDMMDQFTWLTFYTATNVNSAEADDVKKNLVDGNKYGGQLLVKINREMTKNPNPIGSRLILFNKSTSDANDLKSKLFSEMKKELDVLEKKDTY